MICAVLLAVLTSSNHIQYTNIKHTHKKRISRKNHQKFSENYVILKSVFVYGKEIINHGL